MKPELFTASGDTPDTSATSESGDIHDSSAASESGDIRDASAASESGDIRDASAASESGDIRDASAAIFDDFNNYIPGAVLIVKATGSGDGKILYANRELLDLFECRDMEELTASCGDSFISLVYPDDREGVLWSVRSHYAEHLHPEEETTPEATNALFEDLVRFHYRIRTRTGRIIEIFDHIRYRRMPDNTLVCYGLLLRSKFNLNLIERDRMTGLPTMHAFFDEVQTVLDSSSCHFPLHYIYINITRFKGYNLAHGINSGNAFIRQTAEILKHCFPGACVGRFNEDHFGIFTLDEGYMDAVQRAQHEVHAISPESTVELEAGICNIPDDDENIPVNLAFDLAKLSCENPLGHINQSIGVYNRKMADYVRQKVYIEENIDTAIARGYIKVYYQPVIRTISGTLCSFEALSRWIDPTYGFMNPGVFIPTLEENHLIYKLDLYVLEEICRQISVAEAAGRPVVPVSFNLSRIDFLTVDMFAEINRIVTAYHVSPHMIRIEIIESTAMQDPERMSDIIRRFRTAGFQVWMDDFGSGYSSLNMLRDFHFDDIKLDMAFLHEFTPESREIVTSTTRMIKNLHIHTLAEGVETEEQVNFLKNIGCEKMQGYFYGKPAPYEESMRHITEDLKITPETRAQYAYLEKIGELDFQTEQVMTVAELLDDGSFHTLFVNPPFRERLQKLGGITADELLTKPLDDQILSYHRLIDFVKESDWKEIGTVRNYFMADEGRYVRLSFRLIARGADRKAFTVVLHDLTHQKLNSDNEMMDFILRSMLDFYDDILLIKIKENYVETTSQETFFQYPSGTKLRGIRTVMNRFTESFIYAPDREAFMNFMDKNSLIMRIRNARNSSLMGQFRVITKDGGHEWRLMNVYLLPTVRDCVVFCIRKSILQNQDDDADVRPIRS